MGNKKGKKTASGRPHISFMRGFTTIWKKEMKGFFYSRAAYVVLSGFVLLTSWLFFSNFWIRNQASVRTLFSNLPVIFLFFSSLITMKMWAEERSSGTQDQLFSLPIGLTTLTLGKLAACLTLLVVALLFTLPYPILAELYGNLDWGPVWGGYIGAFLMGGAYMALGLFVSSLTRTQIEAVFITLFLAGVLYIIGEPMFTSQIQDPGWYAFFSRVGMGARFNSIARGVLDIRDLLYYLSMITFFVVINVSVLRHKKWL